MKNTNVVKGFKVFNPDWTCRGFQFEVGQTYEEDVKPIVCDRGFHFCEKASDCFNYYSFNPENKVAEVIALGEVDSDGVKSCTDKIQIVREVPWDELLRIVNTGKDCTGLCNTGDRNTGDRNTGNCNTGDRNTGNWNTGDWNKSSCNTGCFNTEQQEILMFNKPSDWTYDDWLRSDARYLLNQIPKDVVKWIYSEDMTDEEKAVHPTHETTGGYLKVLDESECGQIWWDGLPERHRDIIRALPNFDEAIFEEVTGIKVVGCKCQKMISELEELKWDIREYIKHGEKNNLSDVWMRKLENASARYHISRLESLKLQLQQATEVLFGNQLDDIDRTVRAAYKSGYLHTAYEIQKGTGVGWNLASLDERKISKVINTPWAVDGRNFSERIWSNRQKLVEEMNRTITQNIILGQNPQKAIDKIAKTMHVSKVNAGRLVMTEEAFFSSASQRDCFEELDVEQFEIVATLDSRTSDICRNMDRKHFPMSQWEVGVTAPPFHVMCRSTTAPYFGDEFDSVGERSARGEDGKTYYVPADMTYGDWKKAFVDGDKFDVKTDEVAALTSENEKLRATLPKEEVTHEKVKVVEGKNLIGDIDYSDSEFDFCIEKTIHEQGFDGVPDVVEYEEFKKAMGASNFYAERTYSANTQELLDTYRNELYNGKWYIDCSEGGAQYGQGMYCASCYDLTNNQQMGGIGFEMSHYHEIGISKGNGFSYTEAITIQPDAKIFELPNHVKAEEYISEAYRNAYVRKFATKEQMQQVEEYIDYNTQIMNLTFGEDSDFIDNLYQNRAKATVGIEQLLKDSLTALEDITDGRKYHGLKNPGVLVAEMGYDAIKAVGHGESGSYTVILNRTKVIFCKGGSIYGN